METIRDRVLPWLRRNDLKLIACVSMLIDHLPLLKGAAAGEISYYDFPDFLLHTAGRIAAPIFFYLLAKGYSRTRDVNRYALRLLVFAAVSYLPFIWYFRGSLPNAGNFLHLNVLFTMLFGLLILRALKEIGSLPLKAAAVTVLLILASFADYGALGILFILCFAYFSGDAKRLAVCYCAICGVLAFDSFLWVFDGQDTRVMADMVRAPYFPGLVGISAGYFLPLFFILAHERREAAARAAAQNTAGGEGGRNTAVALAAPDRPGPVTRWFFYAFYPLHITVLLLIRMFR